MNNMDYVIAVPLEKKLAEFIGKKGSENSISFYDRKMDNNVIVALVPTSLEEKFYAVAEAMLLSSQIIMSTANIDKNFGEMLLACSLLSKHVIFTSDNNIDQFLSGIKLKDFEFTTKDELLQKILAYKQPNVMQGVRIDVDKAFDVKGIGMVALGIITQGSLKVHDSLSHSSGKAIDVKSIQSQDVDIAEAGCGTRVGLALKGITSEEMQKGDLLSKVKIDRKSSIKVKIMMNSLSPEEIKTGGMYSLIANFNNVVVKVEDFSGGVATLKLEKASAIEKGDTILLIREKVPRIFASGEVL